MKIKRGSTSVRRLIFVADSSSTTGAGLTGLAHNTSGLVAYYFAGDLSNEVQITLASATLGSWTSGGWVAVDNTNMPGWYEVGIPDAALDGGNEVAIQYRGATNMVPVNIYIELDAVDYQSATTFGLSKFGDIETDTQDIQSRLPAALVSGRIDASVGAMAANTLTASALATDAATEIVDAVAAASVEGYTQDEATVASVLFRLYTMTEADGVAAFRYTPDAVDRVWDVPYAQHTTAGSFGKLMDTLRKANMVVDGVVTSAASPTTTSFSSDVNYPTGAFKHAVLLWVNGSSIAEQNSPILTYTNTNGVITVEEAFTTAPQVGDEFVIIPTTHVHAITAIQSGLATSSGVTAAFSEIKGAGWSSGTDTLEEIRDAVDAIDGGGGSITTPIVGIVPVRSQETLLRVYMGETVSQQITVYEADGETPVSLSGKTLEIVFEGYMEDDISVLASNQITVSGTDNNVVTFNYPSAVTDDKGKYFWSLRDANSPYTVYLNGEVHVLRAAVDDP